MTQLAIITGFGQGLSEQLATSLIETGYRVIGISRSTNFVENFKHQQPDFFHYICDVSDNDSVAKVFPSIIETHGTPDVLIHNAAKLHIGDFLETTPGDFEDLWRTNCLGAVNTTQQVIPAMLNKGQGTIILTGATASSKGSANFSAFASSKFALRGLSQSLARAYNSKGIHVVHTIIDGVIWGDRAENVFKMDKSSCIDPQDIASIYLSLIEQPASAWTHELDLRPSSEVF